MPATIWTENIYFGVRRCDSSPFYLCAPTWDNGTEEWDFGYLGNPGEHYSLYDYAGGRLITMRNALKHDYELTPSIEYYLSKFCDLMTSAYTLSKAAKLYNYGMSNICNTGLESILKDGVQYERINGLLLPTIFDKVYELVNQSSETTP